MQIRNTPARWGAVAVAFHWLMGVLLLVQLAHGWWMVTVTEREPRFAHFGWHASMGLSLLALLILRLCWRLLNPTPMSSPGSSRWMRVSASFVQLSLYLTVFVMAIVGWALAGTFRVPLGGAVFGLVEPPAITSPGNRPLHEALEQWHGLLAWPLTALIAVHVIAALYHLWIKRDGSVQRMWFQRPLS